MDWNGHRLPKEMSSLLPFSKIYFRNCLISPTKRSRLGDNAFTAYGYKCRNWERYFPFSITLLVSAVKSKNDAINQLMFLDPSDENKSLETGGERIIVIQKSDGGCRPYLPRDRLVLGISTPNTALRYIPVIDSLNFSSSLQIRKSRRLEEELVRRNHNGRCPISLVIDAQRPAA
ncbi:unnamed protein product, partial [Nesidiocoris tenuis]